MSHPWTLAIVLVSSVCLGSALWHKYPELNDAIFALFSAFLSFNSSLSAFLRLPCVLTPVVTIPIFLISQSITIAAFVIPVYIPFLCEDFVVNFIIASSPIWFRPLWLLFGRRARLWFGRRARLWFGRPVWRWFGRLVWRWLRLPLGSAAQSFRNSLIRWSIGRRMYVTGTDWPEDGAASSPFVVEEAAIDNSRYFSDQFVEALIDVCGVGIDFVLYAGELGLVTLIVSLLLLSTLPLVGTVEVPLIICAMLLGALRWVQPDTWMDLLGRLAIFLDWIFGFDDDVTTVGQ